MICEIPDVQVEFRKGRGTRNQIANIPWTTKKQESSRKTSTSATVITGHGTTDWFQIGKENSRKTSLSVSLHPKGNQPGIFMGRTDAEKLQYFGHLM